MTPEQATQAAFKFTPESESEFQALLPKYPTKQAVVLPALWIAQRQNRGYLSLEAMDYVAQRLEQSPVSVYAVAEFYTLFRTTPPGKHVIQLCQTLTCTMRGCVALSDLVSKRLDVRSGETTDDGMFTFELVECLGSCGTAPMMRMDNRYYENLTEDKLDRIIRACKEGRDPAAEDHD